MTTFSWDSEQTELLVNPRFPNAVSPKTAATLKAAYKGHVWVTTSGSSGCTAPGATAPCSLKTKWVALSKQALLESAAAVNKHLVCAAQDIWINPLPHFHVGGLGIQARAHLSGSRIIDFYSQENGKWNVLKYYQTLGESHATLSALVPAQVFDLVTLGARAPDTLRAIVVGGGALHESLYRSAQELGWKLLPSYGLTECASQVATAPLATALQPSRPPLAMVGSEPVVEFPALQVLSHVEIDITPQGTFSIRSPSLLTTYAYTDDCKAGGARGNGFGAVESDVIFVDPKVNGWFHTDDRGMEEDGFLHVWGRAGNFLKIGGESVDFGGLECVLDEVKRAQGFAGDVALVPIQDDRLGYVIHLACAETNAGNVTDMGKGTDNVTKLLEAYHGRVMPFERIRKVHYVPEIPRSSLNKVLRADLYHLVQPHL